MLNQIVVLYPGERIELTDEMRKTAPFSRCYLPKFDPSPAFSFSHDSDTGMFRASDDELHLVAGGLRVATKNDPAFASVAENLSLTK